MGILLDIVAIIQWILYAYVIIVAIYGIVRLLTGSAINDTIESPLLGLKKMTIKTGFIVWLFQGVAFGFVANDLVNWIRFGIIPLIQIF